MTLTQEEIDFALELFSGLGPLTHRKMMGGLSIYSEGTIFAMVHGDGRIMIKGAGAFIDELEAADWEHWSYSRKNGKQTFMPYWAIPDDLRDDANTACDWARRALLAL